MATDATETKTEFAGEMAYLVLGLLVCFPVGIYYYFSSKEERQVCQECRETADLNASKCPNCGEGL